MGYTWILDLGMMVVDIYFWCKERTKSRSPGLSAQCRTCRSRNKAPQLVADKEAGYANAHPPNGPTS
jgi:hypothetical protein